MLFLSPEHQTASILNPLNEPERITMISPRRKGRSSERIGEGLLRKLGYEILETNKIVEVEGEEAFEIDIVARNPEGEMCSVEVKAGEASVSDIRHAYANCKILNWKPIVICKALSNESAEAVAEQLEVKIIRLRDYYLIKPEELETLIRSAMRDVLTQFGFYPLPPRKKISKEDMNVISALADAESFTEASNKIGVPEGKLGRTLGELKKKGLLPRQSLSFSSLKRFAEHLLRRYSLSKRIDQIERQLKKIEEKMAEIQQEASKT